MLISSQLRQSFSLFPNNKNLSKIVQSDDFIIVDAYAGKMVINPTEHTIELYKKQKKKYLVALKKMDNEGGLEILDKIMAIQTEMIDLETKRDAAKRKLEGYLKCSDS